VYWRVALYPQAVQESAVESVILVTYETLLGEGGGEQTEGVETLSCDLFLVWVDNLIG